MYDISNNNRLMSASGVDGIKAGTSRAPGPCLLLSVTRNAISRRSPQTGTEVIYPQRMIIAVLGSASRYSLASEMMNTGWRVWENWQASGMDMKDPKGICPASCEICSTKEIGSRRGRIFSAIRNAEYEHRCF